MNTKTILILGGGAALLWYLYEQGAAQKFTGVDAIRAGAASSLGRLGLPGIANHLSPTCCTGCQSGAAGCAGYGTQAGASAGVTAGGVPIGTTIGQLTPIDPGTATNSTPTTQLGAIMGGTASNCSSSKSGIQTGAYAGCHPIAVAPTNLPIAFPAGAGMLS